MDLGDDFGVDWGRELKHRWLDSDHKISLEMMRIKKWVALPVPDILNAMEAEWLADAIRRQGVEEAIGVAFEYNGEPTVEVVPVKRDSILTYNGGNSWRYIILTSSAESFLYFKDQANRFFLLCGRADFISQAYRTSWETAKIMYFDELEDMIKVDPQSDTEKRFMTEIWNKYATLIPEPE